MEKALALNRHEWRKAAAAGLKGFDLLYLGDEFCEQLIPEPSDLEHARKIFKGRPVLVTPLLTDTGIDAVERLILGAASQKDRLEIVVNDLGLLHLIRERYAKRVRVALGRIFGHRMKVMPALFAARFLKKHGVRRIEIDDPALPDRFTRFKGIKLSFHSPFRYMSATRFCPWERHWPGPCADSCRGKLTRIQHPRLPSTLLLKGCAYGIKTSGIPAHPMIDRVVTERLPARGKK
jgi:hypothetical protein